MPKDFKKTLVELATIVGLVLSSALGLFILIYCILDVLNIDSTPTPTPTVAHGPVMQSDPIAALASQLDWGSIALAAPETMQVRSAREVTLAISPAKKADVLQKELQDRVRAADLQIVSENDVKLSSRMEANLSGAGFTITETSPKTQAVLPNEVTTWRWQIESKETGEHFLYLSLDALIAVNDRDTPYVVRTYSKKIAVEVTLTEWMKHFVQTNWQWLWAVIVAPVIIIFWGRIRKKRKQQRDLMAKDWEHPL